MSYSASSFEPTEVVTIAIHSWAQRLLGHVALRFNGENNTALMNY